MTEKRKISILIPYKISDEGVKVFLQKRSKNAERLPDWFGFWGGGTENNETPEETLKREIKEEMNIDIVGYSYFGKYEFYRSIKDFYTLKVDNSFESKIEIGEGEYGRFFSENEIRNEEKLILEDKTVLNDFFKNINS